MNSKTKKQSKTQLVSPDFVVKQLNEDTRNAVLIVSLLVNAFLLTSWLVIEVSNNFDAALINYLLSNN